MTENVTVREPEAEEDRTTQDQPNQRPAPATDRAGQAAPATPQAVTTADMAAASSARQPADDQNAADQAAAAQAAERRAEAGASPSVDADQAAERRAEAGASPSADADRSAARADRTVAEVDRKAPDRGAPDRSPAGADEGESSAPLFGGDQASSYRSRWAEIQAGFVDEPRAAVQEADALVAEVMRQLARTFADERRRLEGQLAEGEEASTEDLRIALRRYRSFFDRLLSV
jgi:hypothetical protein